MSMFNTGLGKISVWLEHNLGSYHLLFFVPLGNPPQMDLAFLSESKNERYWQGSGLAQLIQFYFLVKILLKSFKYNFFNVSAFYTKVNTLTNLFALLILNMMVINRELAPLRFKSLNHIEEKNTSIMKRWEYDFNYFLKNLF